jgi:hypothetical protein
MTINFLFGAGLSVPTGIKITSEITQIILNGDTIVRGHAENYYFDYPQNYEWDIFQKKKERVLCLLKIIKQDYDKYYKKFGLEANYETLYYCIELLYEEWIGGIENHFVYYFFEKYRDDFKKMLVPIAKTIGLSRNELLKETKNYISWILLHLLDKVVVDYSHLDFLTDCIQDSSIELINIFTLNNDTVLEQCFKTKDYDYIDGFKLGTENDYTWDVTTYEDKIKKIHLLKNHGSIDWFHSDRSDWYGDRIIKYKKGKTIRDIDLPIFLIGTFNKEESYLNKVFLELFYTFYKKLNESELLIISGYSFGDRAINTKIIEWYYTGRDKKIMIVHPDCKTLRKHSRGAIRLRWGDWENDNRLITIEKKIENTTWAEMKEKLFL